MKCDELQERWFEAYPIEGDQIIPTKVYGKKDTDDAIAELKDENQRLKKKMDDYHLMSDIRRAKIKELKRALWLARAESAKDAKCRYHRLAQKEVCDPQPHGWRCYINGEVYPTGKMRRKLEPHYWCDIWDEVEHKCRAKAEEYK